jgi:hypothetical protein
MQRRREREEKKKTGMELQSGCRAADRWQITTHLMRKRTRELQLGSLGGGVDGGVNSLIVVMHALAAAAWVFR